MDSLVRDYFTTLQGVLDRLPVGNITRVVEEILEAGGRGSTIFLLGNGGSAATASHFACDLAKGTQVRGQRSFRVIALTDNVPLITAWGNDTAYDRIFAEQLRPLVQANDLVIGISGSGNSMNVIKAIEYANKNRGKTVGISGYDGGKLLKCAQENIHVPSFHMQQVEDVHLLVLHLLMCLIRDIDSPKLRTSK